MDRVSVLIPTFRRNAFLCEALGSLSEQTHREWEAIIVDNSGTEAARSVVEQFGDSRFIYVANSSNVGECAGRNQAFRLSSGDHICYLDDDDVLPNDSLESRVSFLRSHPEAGMIFGEFLHFRVAAGTREFLHDDSPTPYRRKRYYSDLLERVDYGQRETFYFLKQFNFVRGGTPLIRRRTLEQVGLFDERLVNFGNYEMWLRIASSFRLRFLNKVVYLYRQHDGSVLRRTDRATARQCAEMICQRYGIRDSLQFEPLLTPAPP